MVLRTSGDRTPSVEEGAYIDDMAVLIGAVVVREGASVWPCALIRADDDEVVVGAGSAVMDMAFLEAPDGRPVRVGKGCLISHGARLHGCVVGDGALVGIGAIVLDRASVGAGSVVAAGCVVTPGSEVPPRSVVAGVPAKIVRTTTDADEATLTAELGHIRTKAERYLREKALR